MFWTNYVRLCASISKAPNVVAAECGVKSTGTVTGWKNGAKPRDNVLIKIADYFGISADELVGDNTKKEKPVNDNIDGHDKEALDKEVLNLLHSLSPAQLEQAKTYLEFLSQKDNL